MWTRTFLVALLLTGPVLAAEDVTVELRAADPAARGLQAAFEEELRAAIGRAARDASFDAARFTVRGAITIYADRAMLSVQLTDVTRTTQPAPETRTGSIAEIDRLQRELAEEVEVRMSRLSRRNASDVPPDPAEVRTDFERALRTSLPAAERPIDWKPRARSERPAERADINARFHRPAVDPRDLRHPYWWCW
jgi:hypothetical protein